MNNLSNNSISHIFDKIYKDGKNRFLEYLKASREKERQASSVSPVPGSNPKSGSMGLSYRLPYLNAIQSDYVYNVEVRKYKKDVKVTCEKMEDTIRYKSKARISRSSRRGSISYWSRRSRKRLIFLLRNTSDSWKILITLTYPGEYPKDLKISQRHLNAFLQFLRRQGAKYIWVKEFQERGAVHYHIFTDKYIDKDQVAYRWYEIVGSGDVRHLQAGTRVEYIKCQGLVYKYISDYIAKADQKAVPDDVYNVGRFWGCSRGLLLYVVIDSYVGNYRYVTRKLRGLRRWTRALFRSWGIKWRYRGYGFTIPGGSVHKCVELLT